MQTRTVLCLKAKGRNKCGTKCLDENGAQVGETDVLLRQTGDSYDLMNKLTDAKKALGHRSERSIHFKPAALSVC